MNPTPLFIVLFVTIIAAFIDKCNLQLSIKRKI